MAIEEMTDDELKNRMRNLLLELIQEAQEPAEYDDADCDPAEFFGNVSVMIADSWCKYDELGGVINESIAYEMLAFFIENAIKMELIEDDEEWQGLIELFNGHAEECAGKGEDSDLPLVTDPVKWISILNTVVFSWINGAEKYAADGFTDYERVYLIREILIHLRNQRVLVYDPWLKDLLADLLTDWQIMGGGFIGPVTGNPAFSWAGQ